MKQIQANDYHHHHQFPNGIFKTHKYSRQFFLLALISLVILITVPLYRPSINYTSFFITTPTTSRGSNSSSSSSSSSGDDSNTIANITIPSSSIHKCDLFSGEWIPNPEAPYYTNTTCTAIHDHQNCMKYGRPDSDFMKWKWKPNGCELPVFDPVQFLELVRDKALAFVGDSVARNHMQSLICLLSRVEYPIDVSYSNTSDDNYFKFKRLKYTTYNFTLATFWTVHLVKSRELDPNVPDEKGSFSVYLDEFDEAWTTQVDEFDYIIISSGQWFLRPLVFYENNQVLGSNYLLLKNMTELGIYYGYGKAFRTAFKAINGLKNYKGITYLRTYVPSHFENGIWNQGGDCVRTRPFRSNETLLEGQNLEFFKTQVEEFRTAEKEGRKRGLKFRLLDTTQAMLLRPDGHPSKYGHWPLKNVDWFNDCVHWCLPGPIDTWNDFLLEMMKNEQLILAEKKLLYSSDKDRG